MQGGRVRIPGIAAFLALCVAVTATARANAQGAEDFEFFAVEAEVISASHRPQPIHLAPATVYVVSHEDIMTSGAQTLWDALRAVPGVDVVTTRTFQGEVGIRGLNRAVNNRTLVLLDGKTVLNGFADWVTWESIPVVLDEIDRIEVVEGAVSALHGANAVNGVINIITRSPENLPRGLVRYSSGQHSTNLGTAILTGWSSQADYKLSVGWRATNQFGNREALSSEVSKLHTQLRWRPSARTELGATAGFANVNTDLTTGSLGAAFDDGPTGFGRIDLRLRDTQLRAFWNRGRTFFRGLNALREPQEHYDTYDVSLQRTFDLPGLNALVVGGGYRHNTLRSMSADPSYVRQDLAAAFFEDTWSATPRLSFVISARLDRHPLTHWVLSPRGTAIFHPSPRNVFRISGGSSFRNPTLLENFLAFSQASPNPGTEIPNPPYETIRTSLVGNLQLEPERLQLYEVAYQARLGKLRTTITGYRYRLADMIRTSETVDLSSPPTLDLTTSFVNRGEIHAVGGEWAGDLRISRNVRTHLNYSYQSLRGETAYPRHKVNGGIRLTARGLTASLWAHWTDKSFWSKSLRPGSEVGRVESYGLLNSYFGYRFSGHLRGLEVGLSAFNLANNEHYQILPALGQGEPGQNGEIIRSRWLVSASYRLN
ncbi:MAG: TonB-dependent receptor plug domain-containing protein [Candidatus Krumholzibacteriia bacterium]